MAKTMRNNLARRRAAAAVARAFTLIELLVVIGIIAIIAAATFPFLRSMAESTNLSAAVNAVSVGVAGARPYATRTLPNAKFNVDLDPSTVAVESGQYSGTAALFTPANEIRIVENIAGAVNEAGTPQSLELMAPLPNESNGYNDISGVDYVRIPQAIGVAGVVRDPSGVTFLPPPFAIRFDQHGTLVAGTDDPRAVFYDANYDGKYHTTAGSNGGSRTNPYGGGTYDPAKWDPWNSAFVAGRFNTTRERYELPFERIETVVAVVIYSKRAMANEGLSWGNPADAAAIAAWLQKNGQTMFFSRYTGVAMRELNKP